MNYNISIKQKDKLKSKKSKSFIKSSIKKRNIKYDFIYNEDLKHKEWTNIPEDKFKFSCKIINDFFIRNLKYVHVEADTQMGKTCIINAVSQLIMINIDEFNIHNIFIFTGMSDISWVEQTISRIHPDLKHQVYHNNTLNKMAKQLEHIHDNIFLIWDESHTASGINNNIAKKITCLTDGSIFNEKKNIYLLTLSATSPIELKHIEELKQSCIVRRIPINKDYCSIKTLFDSDRIRSAEELDEDTIFELMNEMLTYDKMKYHFIRLSKGIKYNKTKDIFINLNISEFDEKFQIIEWNSSKKGNKTGKHFIDINTILSIKPKYHTIIIVIDMFRASKTLNDKNIGIMYDRHTKSQMTSTTKQSFLGRASGYNRSNETIIYTNMDNANKCLEIFENGWLKTRDWTAPHSRMNKDKQFYSSGKEIQTHITGEEIKIAKPKQKYTIEMKKFKLKDYDSLEDMKNDINDFWSKYKDKSNVKRTKPQWKTHLKNIEDGFYVKYNKNTRTMEIPLYKDIKFNKGISKHNMNKIRLHMYYENINHNGSLCCIVVYSKENCDV